MRGERGAGPFVTRYQEGRPAVVALEGSVWRSIARPRAFAPGISDSAKRRIHEQVVRWFRPKAVHRAKLCKAEAGHALGGWPTSRSSESAGSPSAGRVVRIVAGTLRG